MDREHDRIWEEIRRLRDRVHAFASSLKGLQAMVQRNRERLDELEPLVRELSEQEAIAEAIADKLDERDQARESRLRVWSIRAGILAAVVGAVIQILREVGVLGG